MVAVSGGRLFTWGCWWRPIVAAPLVLVAVAASAPSADAAGWSVMPMPAGIGELTGVSCVSVSSCFAVASGGDAVRLAGGRWSIEPSATKGGGTSLDGVSCVSATACTAVGGYGATDCLGVGCAVGVAERWLGGDWSAQPIPPLPPNPAYALPAGISCTTERACITVGRTSQRTTLVDRLRGTRWSISPTPNPRRSGDIYLTAVSCTSATFCIAVGRAGWWPLIERLQGSRWRIERVRGLGWRSELTGVSCTSMTFCMAVGVAAAQGTGQLFKLAERYDGSRWSIVPTAPYVEQLRGVSCTSQSACTAVGSNGRGSTFAERWNGADWSTKRTPRLRGRFTTGSLAAVSCASATACIAVGSYRLDAYPYQDQALVERWTSGR